MHCAAVLDGSLKYHQCLRLKRFELYDIAVDPDEQVDISADRGTERERLEKALSNWRVEEPDRPVEIEGSAETKAALEALGYIE